MVSDSFEQEMEDFQKEVVAIKEVANNKTFILPKCTIFNEEGKIQEIKVFVKD